MLMNVVMVSTPCVDVVDMVMVSAPCADNVDVVEVATRPGISNFQCLSSENLVTFSIFWCPSFYVPGNLVPVKYFFYAY